ncbi:small subunit ribosomal protein S18 [Klenkia soli]|uniref:Small ribosomal subunit protein bS18 n=1 Tax=Klenkia soli TaxID=1052260 RepID=A0A1H0RV02_9ACTN|nr:30S ribosomal protein S18 [Klenkia soli]SDP33402.1 small subunit ribosomal protein S18 [Klenkia soli]
MKPPPRPRRTRRLDGPVDWKDAQLLRTFVGDRGKIRARRVTGLEPKAHREVSRAIKNAREMALLPYPSRGR